ncbi:hypothetical protein BABINDRAFT_180153 [Babjeviella inositovora NRRL Y-12698]|uniref:Peptidase S8/S53 domain-containing protein n=1 Tax=Babjeviella inositovora NRRL Y-12698 TaxID=984486 RepID=A0A1E3QRG3_9ASCO|nr:uncharacterized protein BABINDRAFT_180153 [Babjeviella inositovora NRRL Y-12698]ODQ80240.1 hypothetical protein BABINDRAFT_180153 [Babjeviella inositovora NRRL Y-12698]
MRLLLCIPLFVLATDAINFIVQLEPDENIASFVAKHSVSENSITGQRLLSVVAHRWGNFRAISGEFSMETLKKFYFDEKVVGISIDRTLAIADVQEFAPKHLARISQKESLSPNQPLDYVYDPSLGVGVDVHILDTGVKSSHPDIYGRVSRPRFYVATEDEDPNGHGTALAGLVGGETYGVAKRCNIFDHPIANSRGKTKISAVLAALDLVVQETRRNRRPAVVLLALTMPKNNLLNHAIEEVIQQGIPIVTSAGNSNSAACMFSPASAKRVLTVGSIDVRKDTLAAFSNYGACVDVFAPGVDVTTIDRKGAKSTVKSGTSMSAAITAGYVAYLMGMGADPETVIEDVINSATTNAITQKNYLIKPYTPNRILYNGAGHPTCTQFLFTSFPLGF